MYLLYRLLRVVKQLKWRSIVGMALRYLANSGKITRSDYSRDGAPNDVFIGDGYHRLIVVLVILRQYHLGRIVCSL